MNNQQKVSQIYSKNKDQEIHKKQIKMKWQMFTQIIIKIVIDTILTKT